MGYCTAEQMYSNIVEMKDSNLDPPKSMEREDAPFLKRAEHPVHNWLTVAKWADTITLEDVSSWLDGFHASLLEGHFSGWKSVRPWEVANLYSDLNPKEAWVGWEVETGWTYEDQRTAVIREFLGAYNNVCIDNEGEAYGVELTWCPKELGWFGQSKMRHPLLFACDMAAAYAVYEHEPAEQVGTHINISTKASRTCSRDTYEVVSSALNRGLMAMTSAQLEELFGREALYGGFFPRGDGKREDGGDRWYEGKLFNTTYDLSTAEDYMRVAARFPIAIDAIVAAVEADEREDKSDLHGTAVNLYDVLCGAAPVVNVNTGYVYEYNTYDCDADDDFYDDDFYYDDGEDC